ncbi:glycosyltransferase family 2 protein [Paenibacillus sp. FSL W7-1332]|uniref:glycosyltransferase family 2 protein n=1 Tax=Paenibacillus sp. FSL W7-1332 TaxID=2921702 RepID=UPI0030D2C7F2
MNHKISIIIPVYNTLNWLQDCVDSILKQSYENIEVILVNDGSTDGSGAICDSIKKLDTRVRVYHKLNSGLSDTRNYGLEMASGKYIIFVDSDDIVAENLVEVLYNNCKENKFNLVQCYYLRFEDKNNLFSYSTAPPELIVYEGKAMHWGLIGKGKTRPMAWAKIFERSLFNDVTFPVGLIHEDEAAIHRILYNAKSMAVINDRLYFYRKTPTSIMNNKFSMKRFDILLALRDRLEFYNNLGWHDLGFATAQRYSVTIIDLYRKSAENFENPSQQLKYLIELYKESWSLLKESPFMTDRIKHKHEEWLEDPTKGSLYNVFEYFSV